MTKASTTRLLASITGPDTHMEMGIPAGEWFLTLIGNVDFLSTDKSSCELTFQGPAGPTTSNIFYSPGATISIPFTMHLTTTIKGFFDLVTLDIDNTTGGKSIISDITLIGSQLDTGLADLLSNKCKCTAAKLFNQGCQCGGK